MADVKSLGNKPTGSREVTAGAKLHGDARKQEFEENKMFTMSWELFHFW